MPITSHWDIPPIEKIHEAFSAIADGRVEVLADRALVKSSDYKKEYTVEWNENTYSSNDNASYYQGYMGYPVIAVLMLQKKIDYSPVTAGYFKGVNWKELNKKHKNKYSEVVSIIMEQLASSGIDIDAINTNINLIYEQIKSIEIIYKRSRHLPPK